MNVNFNEKYKRPFAMSQDHRVNNMHNTYIEDWLSFLLLGKLLRIPQLALNKASGIFPKHFLKNSSF